MRKVQRLERNLVGPSGPKHLAPLYKEGEDIVWSTWKHVAVPKAGRGRE